MGYRNDRDAAFERAEALASEVRQSAKELSDKERQIEFLKVELEATKARPLSLAELEARDEGRAQGRRQIVRGITLVVGIISFVISGLSGTFLGVSYAVNGHTLGGQLSTWVRASGRHWLLSSTELADFVFFVVSCGMTLALVLISIGMIGRTRWSAYAGVVWALVAIMLSIASGAVGHYFIGAAAWISAVMGTIGPLIFGAYAALRIAYELR